jgi:hypothetical protein
MRDPSPYAGQTVRLRETAAELGGHECEVVDWYERVGQSVTWREALEAGDPRAQNYAIRRGLGGLPDDDDVLFGRVDGMGQLIHRSEIDGASTPPPQRGGPRPVHPDAVGQLCPACGEPLVNGDIVAAIPLGPGPNPQARVNARAGLPFECVHVDVHWPCATGDEDYRIAEES